MRRGRVITLGFAVAFVFVSCGSDGAGEMAEGEEERRDSGDETCALDSKSQRKLQDSATSVARLADAVQAVLLDLDVAGSSVGTRDNRVSVYLPDRCSVMAEQLEDAFDELVEVRTGPPIKPAT